MMSKIYLAVVAVMAVLILWLYAGREFYANRAQGLGDKLKVCVVERATGKIANNAIGRIKQIEEVYDATDNNLSDDSLLIDIDGLW
ncbi:MAG: hypothetical protein HF962_00470 [Sulfurovum sp.]|nr:hypothetical protein [Sulfurovum sp.]